MKWLLLTCLVSIGLVGTLAATCPKAEGAEERWSGCWTKFPADSTICKSDFSSEWENIYSECCGALCLGNKVKCRHSFPECKATSCYSVAIGHDTLCQREFGDGFVTCGGFTDCAPGFQRARCCPAESYE